MDYKEQAELNKALAEEWNKASCIAKIGGMKPEEFLALNSTAITDLLARAEAAEDRAEKAERERNESQQEALFCRNGWKKAERAMAAYKIFFDDVSSKPDCNTCCLKQCEYRPEIGQTTRFNCPLWRGEKEE